MAAKATGDRPRAEVQTESIVNRWIVDYYVSLALRAFQGGQYADFCSVKNVVDGVSARPLDCIDEIHLKIQVLQFLTWINEGEELDMSSASDQSITPLELALDLLQPMSQNSSIPHQEFENVCTSVKEMIMVIFIKNNRFDKAKEMLTKHFSRPMVGKRVIFMGLINKRSKRHDVIEQMDFGQFKTEMLAFCQRLCPFPVPFLHKAAKLLIDERLTQRDDNAAGPDEQDEPGPSCSEHINTVLPVSCKHKIIQRTRLEAAYKTLAAKSDMRTFSQLEEELEREEEARQDDLTLRLSPTPNEGTNQGSEEDGLFQRGSCSPMEASPADLPPQTDAAPQTPAGSLSKSSSVLGNRRAYTVAQLVLEPDSQVSSQCTAASPELETEVITEESSQSPVTVSERKASQSPITDYEIIKPSRKHRRRTNHCCSRASTSSAVLTESEDEPPASEANEEVCVEKTHNQSNRSLRSNSSKSHGGDTLSEGEEDPQESSASFRTPVQKTPQQARVSLINSDPDNADDFNIDDSSLDDSPSVSFRPVPQTSSTPDKDSAHNKDSLHSKWKQLYKSAKESKERWSDEESDCLSRKNNGSNESTTSNSTNRKRKWTERETQMLKEGVRKFGEGNWSKIKAYYTFNGRTNVNLKDRWRTLKKLKQD
ncbi:telomeric repeat binding factor a isoform X3 [Scophthalmus maximus]|uniref:telomeric repeat binding factor a isoform X3 n=1 Tax=Scophthalmus maximus TaxID=52904 RepID=UPI0015E0F60E|nr:telomeric repeat binding factor a isoform X3 [Scophthalmus maximus]